MARTASAKMVPSSEFNEAFIRNILTSHVKDNVEILQAQIKIAELHLENQISILDDNEVGKFLEDIMNHKNGTPIISIHAGYIKTLFACEERGPEIPPNITFKILQTTPIKLSNNLKLKAKYYSVMLKAKGQVRIKNHTSFANTLWEIICDNNSSPRMQTQARYYLAGLTLLDGTKLIKKNAALDFMQKGLKNAYISKDQRDHSYWFIKDKTHNYFDQPFAHYFVDKELLILNPEDAFIRREHFNNIVKELSNTDSSQETVISTAFEYVQNKIMKSLHSDSTQELNAFISKKKLESKSPVSFINLDEFLALGIGSSRHYALITAYILDGLTKQISPKTGKRYLSGNVQFSYETQSKRRPIYKVSIQMTYIMQS